MRALRPCGGAAAAAANISGIVSCVCRGDCGVVGRCGVVSRCGVVGRCGACACAARGAHGCGCCCCCCGCCCFCGGGDGGGGCGGCGGSCGCGCCGGRCGTTPPSADRGCARESSLLLVTGKVYFIFSNRALVARRSDRVQVVWRQYLELYMGRRKMGVPQE